MPALPLHPRCLSSSARQGPRGRCCCQPAAWHPAPLPGCARPDSLMELCGASPEPGSHSTSPFLHSPLLFQHSPGPSQCLAWLAAAWQQWRQRLSRGCCRLVPAAAAEGSQPAQLWTCLLREGSEFPLQELTATTKPAPSRPSPSHRPALLDASSQLLCQQMSCSCAKWHTPKGPKCVQRGWRT